MESSNLFMRINGMEMFRNFDVIYYINFFFI